MPRSPLNKNPKILTLHHFKRIGNYTFRPNDDSSNLLSRSPPKQKGQAKFKTHISFSNRYALWIHSTHPIIKKLSKFQNYPTQPQINQKFQNSTQVYIYISLTPKIILQALKQTTTPPHQFSDHPPDPNIHTVQTVKSR